MDFFTTTEFMTDLGLDLREQTAFAIIYSFSQDKEGCWYGSINTLSKWLGHCSVPTTIATLKKLVDKGLVQKEEYIENKVKRCRYTTSKKIIEGYLKNLSGGYLKNLSGGTKIILDNNDIDKSISKNIHLNKDNKGNKRSTTPAFDFLSALLNLGVSESTAKDWLQVRKQKGGVNTQTAFNDICREIDRTGASAEDCIRMAVVNTWRGFKADWYLNALAKETPSPVPQTPSPSGRTSTVEHNLRTLAQLHINAGATTITEDEEDLPF